jgi:hypothetical protein
MFGIVRTKIAVVVFASLHSVFALGATITEVKKKKKSVVVDSGTTNGFTVGAKVCFADAAGANVGCAKISEATETTSTIKVAAKVLKKLKPGTVANLEGAKASAPGASAPNRPNFKVLYLPTPISEMTYKRISYVAPGSNATEIDTLWEEQKFTAGQIVYAGGELEFGVGTSSSIALGGRYKEHFEFRVKADASDDDTKRNEFILSSTTAKEIGGWMDFYFYQTAGPQFFFRLGAGLDYNSMTVNFTSQQLDDNDADVANDLAKASSTLSFLGLRLGIQLNYLIKPVGFVLGIVPIIPVYQIGSAYSAESGDANASKLKGGISGEDDLKTALNHTKGSLGLEIPIGLYVTF